MSSFYNSRSTGAINNENDVFPILSRKREENPVLNGNWEKKQDVVKKVALQPLSISNNTIVDSVSTKTEDKNENISMDEKLWERMNKLDGEVKQIKSDLKASTHSDIMTVINELEMEREKTQKLYDVCKECMDLNDQLTEENERLKKENAQLRSENKEYAILYHCLSKYS